MAWIERTSSGTLRYMDRIKLNGKYRKVSVPLYRDTAQARRKAAEDLAEKIRQLTRPLPEIKLSEAIERYVRRDGIRESTRIYEGSALRIALNWIGDCRMCDLSAPLIKRKMLESGETAKKLNGKLRYIKSLLRWCLDYGYIEDDFISRLRKFPEPEVDIDPRSLYLEPAELKAALDQLSGMTYYATKFLALTGCRVGEMSALLVSDLDGKYIHITKSYSQAAKAVTETKTASSVRDIYIQPELAELLKEYNEWRLLYMMSKGIRTDLLFFSASGGYLTENTLCIALRRKNPKLHPHIFRHSHTALLADQGVPLEAISRRLGHRDSEITRKVYYHVTERQRSKDEQAMASVRIL